MRVDGDALVLEGALTLASVSGLAGAVRDRLKQGAHVIDFRAVTEVDSAAVALALEWLRQAAKAGARCASSICPARCRISPSSTEFPSCFSRFELISRAATTGMPPRSRSASPQALRRIAGARGIDLEVRRENSSGCSPERRGKTTLISVLAGLVRADRGKRARDGPRRARGLRAARRSLGVVPQELVFDPFFTVRETLDIQSGYFGLRDNRA